ncbi:MAG: ABC transporter six-transmembrane domain-containing protein [Pseudomonadota bacterium]
MKQDLDFTFLFTNNKLRIGITWFLVLIENLLIALIPLFIGRAIDALLQQRADALLETAVVMFVLVIVAVIRRLYDTRIYGTMRVNFGAELVKRKRAQPVSQVNARLDMSREIVDFLEEHVPELLTAIMQLVVSIVILWTYQVQLGIGALALLLAMGLLYLLFHQRFFKLNSSLNAQKEQQVDVLELRSSRPVLAHLRRLRRAEVKLSDTEAILYGLLFLLMFSFVLFSLVTAAQIDAVTAGAIFTILSYSWEFVESSIALPASLQQWTRLAEIRQRLNSETVASPS